MTDWTKELFLIMDKSFSEPEIDLLCIDLQIDNEHLDQKNKQSKLQSLIYMFSKSATQISTLVNCCIKQRPELIDRLDAVIQGYRSNPYLINAKYFKLSPQQFVLSAPPWNKLLKLKIKNESDEFWYQVWVRISTNAHAFDVSKIHIELPELKASNTFGEVNNITWIDHSVRMNGKDYQGYGCIFLYILNFEPHEINTFSLSLPSSDSSIGTVKVIAETLSASDEPASQLRSADGKLALSFRPPIEGVTIHSLGLILKSVKK
jgi:hypothetical protein